ncbi:MAG: hypothetical protein IPK82_30825 [Polyangiaceae bacterium]|nr:hypothetical protein [Polyangiaceae bacterium]
MNRSLFRSLICVLPMLLTAWPGPAAAEDIAAAEALFDRGLADMKAGKYETGCTAIAESQRLDPRPGTLFTLATCESEWGKIASAVTRFGDYLTLYQTLPEAKKEIQGARPKIAAETRAKLLPLVPQLTLNLPPNAPQGVVVTRNGEVVSSATLGIALPVDPGEYTLTVKLTNGEVREQKVSLKQGEKKSITLDVGSATGAATAAPSSGLASPSTDGSGTSGRRILTYTVGGVGAVGLVLGGVLGGMAAGQKGTIDAHCGAAAGFADETACDPIGLDAANTAKGLGTGSTVALSVGAVLAAAAVVLFVTEPRPAKASNPTGKATSTNQPGFQLAAGTWAGQNGARFGLRATW